MCIRDSLWDMINLRDGGLAIYGGVLAAFVSGIFFCRWRKVPALPMFDLAAMGFLIGQGKMCIRDSVSPADRCVRVQGSAQKVQAVFGPVEILDESDGETVFTLRGKSDTECEALCKTAGTQGLKVENVLKWMAS